MIDLADINDVSVFSDHVGSRFRIGVGPDEFVAAELVEAEALKSGPASEEFPRAPFSLLFEVDGGIDLPQQMYPVHHDTLGELPLFLVPTGSGKLESIFN